MLFDSGNGNCASTCASFTTLMYEVHDVKIANFGAAKTAFCAMNGAEVLEFALLDSEVKVSSAAPMNCEGLKG